MIVSVSSKSNVIDPGDGVELDDALYREVPPVDRVLSTDEVVWTGTAGYSDVLGKVPVKGNDRFGVGSITKTFVARVILQLVEEGKLDLEKTATDYVDMKVVENVPNADRATLRQLLNHQSGVPTWEFEPSWIRRGRGNEMVLGRVWGKTETLEYATPELTPATHDPGVRFAYSNTNYTLLGLVIEAVTGNDAALEIRRRILEPLGLRDTFLESFENIPEGYVNHYHYATPEFKRIAGVHSEFPEIRESLVESTAGNLSPEWTAGGIVASARDIARWARADLIKDGVTGLLCQPTDASAMAQAIVRLMNEEGLSQRISSEAQKVASSRSWDRVVPLWTAIFRALADPVNGGPGISSS